MSGGIVLGFTATREGMTRWQRDTVWEIVTGIEERIVEAHLGDCLGGDVQCFDICVEKGIRTVGHPPTDKRLRAWCNYDQEELAEDYLKRNRSIVRASMLLIGAPREIHEPSARRAGGTWSTIRYARKRGVPTTVVTSDGSIYERQAV